MSLANLVLNKFSFQEFENNQLDLEIKECDFENFNLILGDNAQGKTRLINVLRFLRDIHKGVRAALKPQGKIKINLVFNVNNSEDKIFYNLDITLMPDGVTPSYSEEVIRGATKLFSRKEGILLNERDTTAIEKFYLPTNIPSISSVNGPEFITLNALKSFFARIILLEANRLDSSNIELTDELPLLTDRGRNASSVLDNWKKRIPQAYEEVVSEFEDLFNFVTKKSTVIRPQPIQGNNVTAPMLFYKEKDTQKEIVQINWSDGMLRSICLIMLPITRFNSSSGSFLRPSLVMVDEIENGLDFNTISHLMNFYESWSSQMQVILTSHSPAVCNFVSPEKWRIAKRKGSVILFFNPSNVEMNLEDERKKLHKDNWEFYRRHIAKSKLYTVQ